jgi:mannosyltransferase OCH1-like enzyme
LHQTGSQAALPVELAQHVQKLKVQNPGWRYEFYDDDACVDFIRKNYDPRIQKAYHRINPLYGAARADFFRYLLIYRTGGVYLDLKSGLTKRLDDIVSGHEYLLSHWDNGREGTHPGWGAHFKNFPQGEFQQWYVASVPGHVFLRAVIEWVLNNIEN